MSQGLNRIRSLVSEIEQIQKQGQKTQPRLQTQVEARVLPFEPVRSKPAETVAPEAPEIPKTPEAASAPGRVTLQWSGSVVLDLRFPHSSETLQLRQVGDLIEIRFSDGKAVHIPFKAVA
jgi:hypothetical protein